MLFVYNFRRNEGKVEINCKKSFIVYGLSYNGNGYLRGFYDRIKQKKGSGKVIIATARKMLNIIYDTLKNDWVFKIEW